AHRRLSSPRVLRRTLARRRLRFFVVRRAQFSSSRLRVLRSIRLPPSSLLPGSIARVP
ncbi:hypothetical protein MUK42_32908, partial [Musa troglodytarum]